MLLKKIVVAEDDDAIAHMVSMALGDAGYLCIRARDGEEALQITKMHQPDLLVLDVMMPKLDGKQVASKLKEDVLLSKIPILMLTALADVDSKIAGLDAGADDYMAKPFDLRELAARIRALVRAARRERDRNGITDLPGAHAIDEHIHGLIGDGEAAHGVMQIAVAGFSNLSAKLGHTESVAFIRSFANNLLGQIRAHDGSFLGHVGGTDFVSSAPLDESKKLAQDLIDGFEAKVAEWCDDADVPEARESIRLVIGIVSSEGVDDDELLAKRLATAIIKARAAKGSNFVFYTEG